MNTLASIPDSLRVSSLDPSRPSIPDTIRRLRQTFESGKTRPIDWRLHQLAEMERMMREHEQDLGDALRADLGKSLFEAVVTEMSFVSSEAKFARKRLARWMKPKRVGTPLMAMPGRSYIEPEPKGVVLIIAPWNYPLAMVMAPLVGAVAAGNCAVMKPSEITSHTSAAIAKILPRYLDNDAFAVIEGGVPETTELLEHAFDHILYTGNERVARVVMTAAAKHLTPVTLELGGKSPCLIDKSADLDVAASRIAWGKFINAGQTCVAPDHVLVHRDVAAKFTDVLAGKIKQFYGDDPSRSPDYCRIASERHTARFREAARRTEDPHGWSRRRRTALRVADDRAGSATRFGADAGRDLRPGVAGHHRRRDAPGDQVRRGPPEAVGAVPVLEEQGARRGRAGQAQRRQRVRQRCGHFHGVAAVAVRRYRQQRHGPLYRLVRLRDVQPHATRHEAQLHVRRADSLPAVHRPEGEADEARALNGALRVRQKSWPRSPSKASRTSGSGSGPSAMKRSWNSCSVNAAPCLRR
jgi:hypothetical protein